MSSSGRSTKILYIEDDAIAVKTLRRIANLLSYDLEVAMTGAEALPLLDPDLDLILTDLHLPDGNAAMLIDQIRQKCPTTPIIVRTAYEVPGDREKAIQAGCAEFLLKSGDVASLIDLFRRYAHTS